MLKIILTHQTLAGLKARTQELSLNAITRHFVEIVYTYGMSQHIEYFDVVIIGAGLSGISAARELQSKLPNKSFLILERRQSIGGTWDLFRYPGIRSDSDMYTMAFASKPWKSDQNIASEGHLIKSYLEEAATETQVNTKIRFQHAVHSAEWQSNSAEWILYGTNLKDQNDFQIRCRFVFSCTGYYNYDKGYTPPIQGVANFTGQIVHAQHWPKDLNYQNKNVVVIGSGATAVTVVPAMAKSAKHVTMLQRSPTYMVSMPLHDVFAKWAYKILPESLAANAIRSKNIYLQRILYAMSLRYPKVIRRLLLSLVRRNLGERTELIKDFEPIYDPWTQRLCLVPNGDLFEALRAGHASVVTDQIEEMTAKGLKLKSGRVLDADIVVFATGLELQLLGGIKLKIDGQTIALSDTVTYAGVMYSGVPNLVSTFGFINASWTLRAELISNYFCRLIEYMDKNSKRICRPVLDRKPQPEELRPFIDNFHSGYIKRSMDAFPKQLTKLPWQNTQNYFLDKKFFTKSKVNNEALSFAD